MTNLEEVVTPPEQLQKTSKKFVINMNPSQCTKTVSSFFFVLFFAGMAQASNFQKIIRSFPDVHRSQIEEVLEFFEGVGLLKNLSQKEVRKLVRALDNPTHLIENSPSSPRTFGSGASLFSHIKSRFFFSFFDLHRDSDALFTKLFTSKSGEKLEELSFEQAKRNWDHFLDEVRNSNQFGYTRIKKTDLEAAAMSFVHQRFSDKYFPDMDLFPGLNHSFTWRRQSLGTLFHNQFNIDHYVSPHFTLTWENPYYEFIMMMIWKRRTNFALINSKEFVLKIWNDATQEIRARGMQAISSFVFLELIAKSIIEFRRSGSGSHPFLEAMAEASREDDRLAQLVGIVDRFAPDTSKTMEDYWETIYRPYILRQIIEASGLEENMTYDLLYRHGLLDEDPALLSQ